ncbi:hypothetical protein P7K49_014861 [Saguinus oedipus]|uniref:Uncharacterized protein n=1 Tax=Saguinus oedipus TaxID=9490 RepID=A0ABQ9V7K6_SAGOE|nr:hypothetical protein P7K49_014861 [Saguinus oedipus]
MEKIATTWIIEDPNTLPLHRGLLICLPREQAARFCAEIKSPKYGEGHQAWIIGIVEKGNRTARIIDKPRIIEVAPQVATQNVLSVFRKEEASLYFNLRSEEEGFLSLSTRALDPQVPVVI